jgi:hypothetical protein
MRRLLLVPVLLALAASAVAAARTAYHHGPPPPPLDRVGARGTPVDVSSDRDRDALARMHRPGATVSRLAERDGRAYYRLASDADCFAVGPAKGTQGRLAQIACMPAFPSAEQPVLDFTAFAGPPGDLRVYRAEGFAADGVASVAFRDSAGALVSQTPVVDNAYFVDPPPSGVVTALVALDSTGDVLYTQPFGAPR